MLLFSFSFFISFILFCHWSAPAKQPFEVAWRWLYCLVLKVLMWQVEKSWRGVMWLDHNPQPPLSPSSTPSPPFFFLPLPYRDFCAHVHPLSSSLLSNSPEVRFGVWRRHTPPTPHRASCGSVTGWSIGLLTLQLLPSFSRCQQWLWSTTLIWLFE